MKRFGYALALSTVLWIVFRIINPDYLGISFRINFITLLALLTHGVTKLSRALVGRRQPAERSENAAIASYAIAGISIFEFLYRPLLAYAWLPALIVVTGASLFVALVLLFGMPHHVAVAHKQAVMSYLLFLPARWLFIYSTMCLLLRLSAAFC